MRAKLSLAVASVLVSVLAATAPADAACKRFGFTVNDYGKEGPTNDAKNLLDKHIAEWAAQNGVTAYQTGKKNVSCELFLDVILFDEHTCTASGQRLLGRRREAEQQGRRAGRGYRRRPAATAPPRPVSKADAIGVPAQQQTAAAPAADCCRSSRPSTPPRPRRSSRSPLRPRRRRQRPPCRPPLLRLRPRRRPRRRRPLSRPARCRLARASPPRSRVAPPAAPPQQDRAAAAAAAASAAAAAERAAQAPRRPPTPPRKLPLPRLPPAPPARPRPRCRRSTTHRAPSQPTTSEPAIGSTDRFRNARPQRRAFSFAAQRPTSRRSRWRSSVSSMTPPTAARNEPSAVAPAIRNMISI